MNLNDKILQLGDTGDSVKILQKKLKILGYYHPIVTGSFGLSTLEGVKAFQKENHLEETGIVNEQTWNLLFSETQPAIAQISIFPTLQLGTVSSFVEDLKIKLKALLYYTGPIDTTFDLETENAVKRFQYNNDLTATGVVNQETWERLNSLYKNLDACVIEGIGESDTYIVQRGDTLYGIARKYNTTVDAIKRLNQLTSDTLSVGQILKIPKEEEEEEIIYVVQRGDTLYGIAREYNTTVDAIKRLNQLTSDTLSVGQILQIPKEEEEEEITYIVQRGDTLYGIAKKYNTTVAAIQRLNKLVSNTLRIGQILQIPSPSNSTFISYIVNRGDTLYGIAREYNTTVDAIQRLNQLTSNTLSVGQILKIPVS